VSRSGKFPSYQRLEARTAERSKRHHAAERRDEEGSFKKTPAMAAGLAGHPWSMEELLEAAGVV
jgi:hypothetical protein